MPTYKNMRAGAAFLSTYGASDPRRVGPEEIFVAHSEEVPESWIIPHKGDRMVQADKHGDGREDEIRDNARFIQLVSDLPADADLTPPKRPAPSTPLSIDQLRADMQRENLQLEKEVAELKLKAEELRKQNLDQEAKNAAAAATEQAKAPEAPAVDAKAKAKAEAEAKAKAEADKAKPAEK